MWCCFVLAEGALFVNCRSANAWLMHFGFTWSNLLMGPPDGLWALADGCCVVLFCSCWRSPFANAWLIHFGFTGSNLLMGPPDGLWALADDGWLLFCAASLCNCNCIVIAFVPFGYKRRFVCLGCSSLVLGGRLFPQACFVFPFSWISMSICTAGFQLVSQACLAPFWSIQFLHLIKKKNCLIPINLT